MVAHLLISQHSLYRLFFFYVQNVSQCNHQRHALHLEQKGVHFVLCFFGAGCLKVRVLLCCSTKVLSVDVCHSNKAPHPPSLYFSSTKTLWANVQIQHRKCLFDTRLSFLSVIMSKKKKKKWNARYESVSIVVCMDLRSDECISSNVRGSLFFFSSIKLF